MTPGAPPTYDDIFARKLAAITQRNARIGAALRLTLASLFTLVSIGFAFGGGSTYLKPYAMVYLALAVVSAIVCVLVARSAWVRQRHFFLLPLLDIPAVTIERWFFTSHARTPGGVGLIALTYFLLFILLSLFSLDRRVVVATTAAALVAGLVVTLRAPTIGVLIATGLVVIALAGAAGWVVVGQVRDLVGAVAGQSRDLRRLLAQLETAREDERARVSHDLHDELGQELSAMSYALTFARRRFRSEPTGIEQNLVELDELLTRTRATVRSVVTELRPRVLDDLGLKAAVEWLVKRTGERADIEVALAMEGDESRVEGPRALAAFRVAQESLTNVVRHASAGRAEVALVIGESRLDLCVKDDGVGFEAPDDKAPAKAGRGAGLLGMRERAGALGGELNVVSQRGAGTEVRLTLPLGPPNDAKDTKVGANVGAGNGAEA